MSDNRNQPGKPGVPGNKQAATPPRPVVTVDAAKPAATEPVRPTTAAAAEAAPSSMAPLAVSGLALVVALGAIVWDWKAGEAGRDQLAAAQDQVAALTRQVQALEARPAAAPVDLKPLDARLGALDARVNGLDLKPLDSRVATLDGRVSPLDARITALDAKLTELSNRPVPEAGLTKAAQDQLAALAGRIDGIGARQDALGKTEQADSVRLTGLLDAQDKRLAAAEGANKDFAALAAREQRTAQLGAAAVALAAGRPLGAIAGAPPALARFATAAPPTEAALRLSFGPAAERAALASQPVPAEAPFLDRVWARAQSSVTVKQGDRVIVGDVVAGVIDRSRRLLDAGDLAGAVSALDGLAGPAAAAMAPWRQQAQSLLDARAALLAVAHG